MKNNFKNYLKLGILLFGISIFIIACQKENIIENEIIEQTNTDYKVKTIYQNTISQNPIISEQLIQFNQENTNGNLQRQVSSATNDFTVDTETATFIEYSNYHSYTFAVQRDIENGLIENLLLSLQADGNYRAVLIAYDLTEDEKLDVINGLPLDYSDKTTFTLIDDEMLTTNLLSRNTSSNSNDCYDEIVIIPSQNCSTGHPYGSGCPWEGTDHPGAPQPPVTILVITDDCFWSSGSGDDGNGDGTGQTSGSGNGTSTGNTGTNPDDPEDSDDDFGGLTSPIIPIETKDCTELKKNSEDSTFKQQMGVLETAVLGDTEKTFGIYNGSYVDSSYPNPSCGAIIEGDETNAGDIPFHVSLKATAHNHLKNATETRKHIGTFSPNDLIGLSNLAIELEEANSPVQKQELATYLVCDEGNYSLKINNINKLYDFAVKYGTDVDFKKIVDDFYQENNMVHGKGKQDQNIGFLKLIQKFDMGTSLYEADSNFENWEQLKLNDSGNNITKQPC